MARPTKYSPTLIPLIEKYIQSCGREQTELPTIEGLAGFLDVNTDTINEWKAVDPEFSAAIKELMDKQKNQLVNDGMYGGKEVNSTMAIFLLKCNHNMIETERIEHTGDALSIILDVNEPTNKIHGNVQVPAKTTGSDAQAL